MIGCPFCSIDPSRVVASNAVAFALRDGYPISEGHTLVVPRIHIASIFGLPGAEQALIWQFVAEVRETLHREYGTHDFNVGVNDGLSAGQTIPHAHVHVIPRRPGDVADPRGGLRCVIPAKARYWED